MSVSSRSVSIYSLKKGRDLGVAQPRRASTFVGQRYTSLLSGDNKNPRRKFFLWKLWKTSEAASGAVFPMCNITTVGRWNKPSVRTGAVVSGHRNRDRKHSSILRSRTKSFILKKWNARFKPQSPTLLMQIICGVNTTVLLSSSKVRHYPRKDSWLNTVGIKNTRIYKPHNFLLMEKPQSCIAVCNQKGVVGKSTFTVRSPVTCITLWSMTCLS